MSADTKASAETKVIAGSDVQAAIDAAEEGGVVTFGPGEHDTAIVVRKSLTLRGSNEEQVWLVGVDGRSIVRVEGEVTVRLEHLTLTGGKAELGAGLKVGGGAKVVARACGFVDNVAKTKGGAVYVGDGEVCFDACAFSGNRAAQGGALYADGGAVVRLTEVQVFQNEAGRGAGLCLNDGVKGIIDDVTFAAQGGDGLDVRVAGSLSRAPDVTITGCAFGGGIEARPESAVAVRKSSFGPYAVGYAEGNGNRHG